VVHLDATDREARASVADVMGAPTRAGRPRTLSNARIARDRIERRVERMLKKPES
jgi:hypothetical protein